MCNCAFVFVGVFPLGLPQARRGTHPGAGWGHPAVSAGRAGAAGHRPAAGPDAAPGHRAHGGGREHGARAQCLPPTPAPRSFLNSMRGPCKTAWSCPGAFIWNNPNVVFFIDLRRGGLGEGISCGLIAGFGSRVKRLKTGGIRANLKSIEEVWSSFKRNQGIV